MASAPDPLLRIPRLYHFTDVRNLPKIRELGGILSTASLRESECEFVPGGNQWSLDQDVLTGMDRYVHLCWATGHPMAWYVTQRDPSIRLRYLQIDRSILYQPGVKFCGGVANAIGMETWSVPEAVAGDMIDYEALYGNIGPLREPEPQARRQKAEKSEILVPDYIPLELIRNFPNG